MKKQEKEKKYMVSQKALKKTLEERKTRFITTSNLQEPDRVPILSQINAYAIGFCNKTAWDVFEDPDLERECYRKANEAFYFDGLSIFGLNHPFKSYFDVGSETYLVSENGVTIQHKESSHMDADEYDEFIADPIPFIANKTAARKIPAFDKDYPENYEALKKLFNSIKDFKQNGAENRKYVLEEMGIPIISSRSAPHPLDNFFDFIRGFNGTLIDIRRHPDKVEKAIEVLTPYYEKSIPSSKEDAFPWLFSTCHIPTFLSKSQFERLYWPYMRRCLMAANDAQTKYMALLEGTWEQHFDLFEDIPKGAFIACIENDDIIKAKKRFGDRMTLAGGMPMSMLKYTSKQECIDYVKRIFDACAPGGGFIFTTSIPPLTTEDLNVDTYRAVNEFAHEYGKY
ncbi:MAG: uroporphyrinogen decarboxylase family protein [Eubacteriales bacterium]